MRGSLRERRGETAKARTDYLAAIDREPRKTYYYASLMGLHGKNKTWNDARTDFRTLTSKHAGVWLAWKALAEACEGDGDPAAACTAYETADRLRPGDPAITRRLAELRAELKKKRP